MGLSDGRRSDLFREEFRSPLSMYSLAGESISSLFA